MSPAENNVLDLQAQQVDRAQTAKGFRFKLFDEMALEPPAKRWLIKGILARGETSAWIAPPGGMKSALLAHASICVAGGLDWLGKRHKEKAGVVYFALERSDLVERRINAHRIKLELSGLPIAVVGKVFDLIDHIASYFPFALSPSSTSRRIASGLPGRSSCFRRQSSSCFAISG